MPASEDRSAVSGEITRCLQDWRGGEEDALARLTAAVYRELRRLASSLFAGESGDRTLQPTALVHELYMQLLLAALASSTSCWLLIRVRDINVDALRTTVRDYATFMISVMNKEGVSQEIAAQRQNITRNLIVPEVESVLCEDATDPANCKVAMGFGLGWRVVKITMRRLLTTLVRTAT
jgi:ECF sigma factor